MQWTKKGLVWRAGNYSVSKRPSPIGSDRYHVTRNYITAGGFDGGDRFASAPTLAGAKRLAQEDHDMRASKK